METRGMRVVLRVTAALAVITTGLAIVGLLVVINNWSV